MDDPVRAIEYESMLLGRYHSQLAPKAREGRLERSAYTLLSLLEAQGPLSIGRISEAFGLDASTLNRQTAALVRDGLAERIADPDGGIARKFRLSAEGRSRLEHDRETAVSALERILAAWSAKERRDFADHLQRFNTDIERVVGRPWPRE